MKSKAYRHYNCCEACGARLDAGERCECKGLGKPEPEKHRPTVTIRRNPRATMWGQGRK